MSEVTSDDVRARKPPPPLHRCLECLIEGPMDSATLGERMGVSELEANAMAGRLATAALTERLSGGQWRLTAEGFKHTIVSASAVVAAKKAG